MKHHPVSLLIPLILLVASPAFASHPDTEALTCADRSVSARVVRTTGDVQAFVQCAYEYVREMGFEEARRAFHEDERWRSGAYYVFVDEVTPMRDAAQALVYPPDPAREGTPWGPFIDAYGNDLFSGTASHPEQLR